ncbi:hypothetical protein LTS17_011673 [Exophiala oligosperma]
MAPVADNSFCATLFRDRLKSTDREKIAKVLNGLGTALTNISLEKTTPVKKSSIFARKSAAAHEKDYRAEAKADAKRLHAIIHGCLTRPVARLLAERRFDQLPKLIYQLVALNDEANLADENFQAVLVKLEILVSTTRPTMDFEAVFSGPSSFEEVGILTRRGKLPSGLEPDPEHHSRDSQELQEGGGVFEKIDMVSVSIEPAEEKMARFTNCGKSEMPVSSTWRILNPRIRRSRAATTVKPNMFQTKVAREGQKLYTTDDDAGEDNSDLEVEKAPGDSTSNALIRNEADDGDNPRSTLSAKEEEEKSEKRPRRKLDRRRRSQRMWILAIGRSQEQ